MSLPPSRGGAAAHSNQQVQNAVATKDAASYRLPSNVCFNHAVKLAIVEDKPIMMDYWTASLEKKALIGVKENNEKLLVKSEEEYTSTIGKFYKSAGEYIIIPTLYFNLQQVQQSR
jgi:hypothetical protein